MLLFAFQDFTHPTSIAILSLSIFSLLTLVSAAILLICFKQRKSSSGEYSPRDQEDYWARIGVLNERSPQEEWAHVSELNDDEPSSGRYWGRFGELFRQTSDTTAL